MITASFLIKSGTCGWHDYDNCDMSIQTIKREDNQFVVPTIGSKIVINTKDNAANKYIVNDVEIYYGDFNDNDFNNTYVRIYLLEYECKHHIDEIREKQKIKMNL